MSEIWVKYSTVAGEVERRQARSAVLIIVEAAWQVPGHSPYFSVCQRFSKIKSKKPRRIFDT